MGHNVVESLHQPWSHFSRFLVVEEKVHSCFWRYYGWVLYYLHPNAVLTNTDGTKRLPSPAWCEDKEDYSPSLVLRTSSHCEHSNCRQWCFWPSHQIKSWRLGPPEALEHSLPWVWPAWCSTCLFDSQNLLGALESGITKAVSWRAPQSICTHADPWDHQLDSSSSPVLQSLERSREGSGITLESFILHISHIILLTSISRPEKILYSG